MKIVLEDKDMSTLGKPDGYTFIRIIDQAKPQYAKIHILIGDTFGDQITQWASDNDIDLNNANDTDVTLLKLIWLHGR